MDRETMIFCTSYISDKKVWEARYKRWLNHHRKVFPQKPIFIIDDGSPFLPNEEGIKINDDIDDVSIGELATVFHFKNRLGRHSITDFPGWFRSFTFSVTIARKMDYRKIIHIESDSFILTKKAVRFVEDLTDGWTAFYCPRWNFPETAFQVVCDNSFSALEEVRDSCYQEIYSQKYLELSLPFTHIEKGIYGDRYGEFRSKVPRSADFAVQIGQDVRFDSEIS